MTVSLIIINLVATSYSIRTRMGARIFRVAISAVEKVNATFTHSNKFFAIFVSGNLLFKGYPGVNDSKTFPGRRSSTPFLTQVNNAMNDSSVIRFI